MHQITIIGAGFGGLTAIRTLRQKGFAGEITLIAPRPELHYYPSLIWIPAGLRTPEQIRIELTGFFAKHRVNYIQASATGLADAGRTVLTDSAGEIKNDALLVASGGRFIKKLPGIEHTIAICEGIDAAVKIKDRLDAMEGGTIALGFGGNPKEPSAMRGGPMFELLFGLDTLLRRQKRRDRFKLVFFNPVPRPGKRMGEQAVDGLMKEMSKRGIDTHLGHKLTGFEADRVNTEGGEVAADLILFMPGMTGPAWLADSGLPLSEGGMLVADQHARVADRVYVAGDSGSYPGPDWMPKQAHMADLQAEAAVINMLAELDGAPIEATFKSELICIVDTLNKGILVYRDPKRAVVTPQTILFHWAKRFFEWMYLRPYRV